MSFPDLKSSQVNNETNYLVKTDSINANSTTQKTDEIGAQDQNFAHTTLESNKSIFSYGWEWIRACFGELFYNIFSIFYNNLYEFDKASDNFSLYKELKASNPEHPFIKLMLHAQLDSAHYHKQNVQTTVYQTLDAAKVTAQDVEEAMQWVGEFKLECWLSLDWCTGDSDLVRNANGLVKALIYKKEFEAKYPNQKITFNPSAAPFDAYAGTKRGLFLIDGACLRAYERQIRNEP